MRAIPLALALFVLSACDSLTDPVSGPSGQPDVPVPAVGAVTGRVLSKEYGVMSGIKVVANPGDRTATTDGVGSGP